MSELHEELLDSGQGLTTSGIFAEVGPAQCLLLRPAEAGERRPWRLRKGRSGAMAETTAPQGAGNRLNTTRVCGPLPQSFQRMRWLFNKLRWTSRSSSISCAKPARVPAKSLGSPRCCKSDLEQWLRNDGSPEDLFTSWVATLDKAQDYTNATVVFLQWRRNHLDD